MTAGALDGIRDRIPYAAFLGIDATMVDGEPRFRLPFRDSLVGNVLLHAVHGGAVAGFMENAAALHLLLKLNQERMPKCIDFSTDFLRAALATDSYAQCNVVRQGRRIAHVQVRCWQHEKGHADRQREVAMARAHFLLADLGDETPPVPSGP